MKHKKWLLWSLMAIWLVIIFLFSAQNAMVSNQQSKGSLRAITKAGLSITNTLNITDIELSEENVTQILNTFDFPIRKLAHMTEYFVLAILLIFALNATNKMGVWNLLLALGICFFYSLTDEFHQLFVPGRSGQFVDCLIDTLGACLACILFWIGFNWKEKSCKSGE